MRRAAFSDTIVAVATPPGRGGLGVIRLSGPASRSILQELFVSSRSDFTAFKPYTLHHGRIRCASGRELDEVLVVFMPGPRSYTGDDVAEIHCHGSPAVLAAALDAACAQGARQAGPGEFTKRAFLAGRLDLTQAEAVVEMINAPTEMGARLALAKLDGVLAGRIAELRSGLEDLRTKVCVAVDFPEEELECLTPEEFRDGVQAALAGVQALLQAHERSRLWRDGALVVLAGQVNVGKSSLMNALLGRRRAIVSAAPGTTRDFLEESLDLDGLPVRLVDTAGLRNGGDILADPAETEGQQMGRDLAAQADLALLVTDVTRTLQAQELGLVDHLGAQRVLIVRNKADLLPADGDSGGDGASGLPDAESVCVSAKTGQGLEDMVSRMRERLMGGRATDMAEPAPNLRQAAELRRAVGEMEALLADLDSSIPYDLLSVRLETVCMLLSGVTGEIASDAVLDAVFDAFCIGK